MLLQHAIFLLADTTNQSIKEEEEPHCLPCCILLLRVLTVLKGSWHLMKPCVDAVKAMKLPVVLAAIKALVSETFGDPVEQIISYPDRSDAATGDTVSYAAAIWQLIWNDCQSAVNQVEQTAIAC